MCSGSQTERISILKMALTEKGVVDNQHYDVHDAGTAANPASESQRSHTVVDHQANSAQHGSVESDGDGGMHL